MFDRNLYNKYDKAGKTRLLDILTNQGYKLVGNLGTEYYKDTDIIVLNPKTNQQLKWEVEVKNNVHFDKVVRGIFKDIIINYRKAENKSDYYCVFSSNYDQMLVASFKDIKSSPTTIINTNRGEEKVFKVDRSKWKLYSINGNNIQQK